MFGRQVFLESVDNQRDRRRRNEFIRQLSANQVHGLPFTELVSVPSFRNDGLALDLNFVLLEENDRMQPNNLYFRNNYTNVPNRYLLEYIRQMEERYLAMEKELTRTKMLIPALTRNASKSSQTDVNWKECSLAKYGSSTRNQNRKNQEQINVPQRRKHHTARKNKDSIGKSFPDTDRGKYKNTLQDDIYPIKEPDSHACRPKTLSDNSTAVCSMHNVAVILPQDSIRSADFPRPDQTNSKANSELQNVVDKTSCDFEKTIFGGSKGYFGSFETQQTSMEVCQSFDKKREAETSYYADLDAKREDHSQTKATVNAANFRPPMTARFGSDVCDRKSEIEQSRGRQANAADSEEKCAFKRNKYFESTDSRRKDNFHANQTSSQGNRNYWNAYAKRSPYERTRVNDSSRHFARTAEKPKREAHKKYPTPRSNVHTAYAPMIQSSTWNPILDLNGYTIQSLRLAVLLYAPALMPALNSLIARQNVQPTIPMACPEGSNDLLTQVFTILSSQQCVPNLPCAPNPTTDDNNSRSVNSRDLPRSPDSQAENLSNQLRDGARFERASIAVNTSLEICSCNNAKQSHSQCSRNALRDRTEENEEIVYSWTNEKSKSSETVVLGKTSAQGEQEKEKDSQMEAQDSEFSQSLLSRKDSSFWVQTHIRDIWKF